MLLHAAVVAGLAAAVVVAVGVTAAGSDGNVGSLLS